MSKLGRLLRRTLRVALGTFALGGFAGPALAQASLEPPSVYRAVDRFGVDLTSGAVQVSSPTISVGDPSAGGLSFTANWDGQEAAWRYSTFGEVTWELAKPDPECRVFYTVVYMGSSNIFRREECESPNFVRMDGYGTLVETASGFAYTARDGSIAEYFGHTRNAPIQTVTKLNGEIITYTGGAIVSSVSNNRGYQLRMEHGAGGPEKVIAINNAVDACGLTAPTCTYSQAWPTLTFQTVGNERWVTDSLNHRTRVILSTTPGLARVVGVARPTQATGASVTYTQGFVRGWGTVVTQVNDGAGTWNYGYESYCAPAPAPCERPEDSYNLDVTVTDPNNNSTVYNIRWAGRMYWDPSLAEQLLRLPSLFSVRNGAGQTTQVFESGVGLHFAGYPEGNTVAVQRNQFGGITRITTTPKPDPAAPLPPTETVVTYPDCAVEPVRCRLPSSVTDRRQNTTDYTYDAVGNLLTETLPPTPEGIRPQTRHVWQQQYAWYKQDGSPSITQAATPIWVSVEQSACATLAGQSGGAPAACDGTADEVLTTIIRQAGSSLGASNLLPIIVSSGAGDGSLTATTTTTYDGAGDVSTVNGPLPGVADTTRYVYDVMRQQIGVIGPDPDAGGARFFPATRTTYNADGQSTKVERGTTLGQTDPDWTAFSPQQTATTDYDAQGRVSWEVVAPGTSVAGLTDYEYDTAGRLICTAQRMTYGATHSAACTPGSAGTFGPDRITRNTYDAADRLTQVQTGYGTPGVLTERLQGYTSNGKIDWIEDGAGNRSDYVYDGFDRLQRLYFPSVTVGAHAANPADYEEYGYDANDNPTTKRTRAGLDFVTAFDTLNRITAIDAPSGSNDVWYRYDNLSRRLSASHASGVPNCATTAVCSTWDALGRPLTETTALGTMTSTWDIGGRRTRLTWPDAYFVQYAYDLDNLMVRIRWFDNSDIIAYAYDDLGRRKTASRGNGVTTAYGYDAASRLASLSHDLAGTAFDVAYAYGQSPASQVTSLGRSNPVYFHAGPLGSATYVNNGRNQIASTGGVVLAWSAQGNLTGDGTRVYAYDAANRLIGTGASTLAYDPLDRLAEMTGTLGARYQYDGAEAVATYVGGSSTIGNRLVRGPWPDELVASYAFNTPLSPLWTLQDHQSSSIAITDPAGAAIYTMAYDEYGVPRSGNAGRFMYTGQLWMPDYAAYHYKARAYRPDLGRFLQTDPVGYEQGLNLYAYVGNDPVNLTDPTGKFMRSQDEQKREMERARQRGVNRAWADERRAVARGGGSREWTAPEREELLRRGRVMGYEGHHQNTVNGHSIASAEDPNNVRFMTPEDHADLHRRAGGTRQPIRGQSPVVRGVGGLSLLSGFTGLLSGRVRTDSLENFLYDMAGYPSPADEAAEQERLNQAHCRAVTGGAVPAGTTCI